MNVCTILFRVPLIRVGEGADSDAGHRLGGDVGSVDGYHFALARQQVEEVVGEVGPLGGYLDEHIFGQAVGGEGERDAQRCRLDGLGQMRPGQVQLLGYGEELVAVEEGFALMLYGVFRIYLGFRLKSLGDEMRALE